jgi:hypothetical protein
MDTPKEVEVRFLKTVVYETDGPKKGPVFQEGHTYKFSEEFAQRWIRRGAAELVEPKPSIEKAAHVSGPKGGEATKEAKGDDEKHGFGGAPAPTSKR